MKENISCPYCSEPVNPSGEKCIHCGKEMPWMTHVYKRETNIIRGSIKLIENIYDSLKNKGELDKSKLTGFLNAFIAGRIVLIIGSISGIVFVIAQISIMSGQKDIMEDQTSVMKHQNELLQTQNTIMEFERYKQVRNILADTTYYRGEKTFVWDYESEFKTKLSTPLNESAINWVSSKAQESPINYSNLLTSLLIDSDNRVRAGAFISLLSLIESQKDSLPLKIDSINLVVDKVDFGKIDLTIKNCSIINSLRISRSKLNSLTIKNSQIEELHLGNWGTIDRGNFFNSKIEKISLSYLPIKELKMNGMVIGQYRSSWTDYSYLGSSKIINRFWEFRDTWIRNPNQHIYMYPKRNIGSDLPQDLKHDSTFYYYNKSIKVNLDLNNDGEINKMEADSVNRLQLYWKNKYLQYVNKLKLQ